jgi:hypothetical protein
MFRLCVHRIVLLHSHQPPHRLVTIGTLGCSYPRVSGVSASKSDASRMKGAPLQQAISVLLRLIGRPGRAESPGWWAYFGAFGDDIFGDECVEDE